MISPRIGTSIGQRLGLAVGLAADPLRAPDESPSGPLASVERVATSGIYCPANAAQWTTLMSVAGLSTGNPSSAWLCQEANGNLADSIGSVTLTANATPLYQQVVSGWSRRGVGLNGGAAQRFAAAAGVGPNPATTSVLWLFYTSITATPGSVLTHISVSNGATNCVMNVTTTPRLRCTCAGVNVAGTVDPTSAGIMPMALLYDRTNSRVSVFTSQEKIAGTYNSGVVDSLKGLGGMAATANTGQCVYGCVFSGAAAELSDAQVKTMLTTLGFTIPWS
jgi:hypothetical protein